MIENKFEESSNQEEMMDIVHKVDALMRPNVATTKDTAEDSTSVKLEVVSTRGGRGGPKT